MMVHEVQIVIRHTDPAKLSDDVRAVAEFIEQRKQGTGASSDRPLTGRPRLQVVRSHA